MTPEQFKERMLEIRKKYYEEEDDWDDCHRKMDKVMCQLLCEFGYEDGVDIFEKTPKWYA